MGGGAAPLASIQAGINAAAPGNTICVYPGTYNESAPGSTLASIGGIYQFGLFFPASKPGLRLVGVDASGNAITNAASTLATINTDATNSFGYSGIFVDAANTTIQGVKLGPNVSGDNKTIEVIADNFTLRYATTNIPNGGGSIYINDFSSTSTVVQSYHVLDNLFLDGTSVDIASGAGVTGPLSGREILGNSFDLVDNGFNGISFNGTGGVAWFTHPVGGAIIKNNSFKNSTQYIRARGVYVESEFDWASYWNDNTFDRAAVALVTESPFVVRSYAYGDFTNVRRIGGTIQAEIDHALAGDRVKVAAGTYAEDVTINKTLALLGAGMGASTIVGPIGGPGSTITAAAAGVLIDGFTITRAGNNPADWNLALNTAGVAVQGLANNMELRNSRLTGLRTGVDINNSNGNSVHNNVITDNRTGLILRNQTDNTSVVNNFITNNWTVGVVFLDASSGTNAPVQTALNSSFSNNDISGNWYGQVVDRQTGGSLPAPGANLKNFKNNWWGAAAITSTSAGSTEPGYSLLIPVSYGGSAVPPAVQPHIAGAASANIDYLPFRCSGDDAAPTAGFQPSGALSTSAGLCAPTPPAVSTAALDAAGTEGQTLTATGAFSGTGLTLSANNTVGTFTPNNSLGTWTWTYLTTDDVALATITVTATDGFAQTASDAFTYQAANVAPSATFNVPSTVAEGSSFSISLTAPTDPSSADAAAGFTYAFNCGSGYGAFGVATSTTCATTVAGALAVAGQVKDKNGGVRAYSTSVTVLSSKQVKIGVRATLAALQAASSGKTEDNIQKAIEHLDKSLATKLWAPDGSHLTSKGEEVFKEEKDAVKELLKVSGAAEAAAAQAALALVNVDKQLAQLAINEAPAGKDKTEALAEMVKAASDLARDDLDKAIDHYKDAWKKVTK